MNYASLRTIVLAAGLALGSSFALADPGTAPVTRPSYYVSNGGTLIIGDAAANIPPPANLSAAQAGAVHAKQDYDQAMNNLRLAVAGVRHDFQQSADFQTAQKELGDAQRNYDAQAQIVKSGLANDPKYKDLLAKRAGIDAQLKSPAAASMDARLEMANQKLQLGTVISAMETQAWSDNADAAAAQKHLTDARAAMKLMIDKFESGLAAMPAVSTAKTSLQNASVALAQANAYLSGVAADLAAAQQQADQGYGNVIQFGNSAPAGYGWPYGYPENGGYGGYPFIYGTYGGPPRMHGQGNPGNQFTGPGGGTITPGSGG